MRGLSVVPAVIAFSFLNCDTSTSPSMEVSNLTSLAGKRFVAYPSLNRLDKPDTVSVDWDFAGIGADEMKVDATIDSGASWISLDDLVAVDGQHASLRWVPGTDTARMNYFGEKSAIIRITAPVASFSFESDSFVIIGPLPVRLDSPTGGETFKVNDTIVVHYRTNTDLSSQFRFFFHNEPMGKDEWEEQVDDGKISRVRNPPVNTYTLLFCPAEWGDVITDHLDVPVRFMLKDYNSPLQTGTVVSGDIFLEAGN